MWPLDLADSLSAAHNDIGWRARYKASHPGYAINASPLEQIVVVEEEHWYWPVALASPSLRALERSPWHGSASTRISGLRRAESALNALRCGSSQPSSTMTISVNAVRLRKDRIDSFAASNADRSVQSRMITLTVAAAPEAGMVMCSSIPGPGRLVASEASHDRTRDWRASRRIDRRCSCRQCGIRRRQEPARRHGERRVDRADVLSSQEPGMEARAIAAPPIPPEMAPQADSC